MTSAGSAPRIHDVDALRGFALLGILIVNITAFASGFNPLRPVTNPDFTSALDDAVRFLSTALFESKFYLLFSFLFGYSFTLQIDSAERRSVPFRPRFLRRLLGLILIGAAHALLLFTGDILTTYALLGLVLLGLRGLSPQRAVWSGVALIVATSLLFALAGLDELSRDTTRDTAALTADAHDAERDYQGSVADVIAQRVSELPAMAAVLLAFQAPTALAMFLFGLAAGRRRVLAAAIEHRPRLGRMMLVGFPNGLAGAALFAATAHGETSPGGELLALSVDILTAPLLTGAYIAAFVLFIHTRPGGRLASALAPMGRMALTNYLLQSALMCLIFTGYGLGLMGNLAPLPVCLIALGIYASLMAFSGWWMRSHPYGPLEWPLRALTNWSLPPWRRPQVAAAR